MVVCTDPREFIHQIFPDVRKGLIDVKGTMGLLQAGFHEDIVNVEFWSAGNEKAKGEVFFADGTPD
jgi:hypothetical protein